MNRPIATYDDLVREKNRLQKLQAAQQELIQEILIDVKSELKPVADMVGFLGKLTTRNKKYYFISLGTSLLVDKVIKKAFPSRSGWLSKLILPFALKNVSSHYLTKFTDQFTEIVAELVRGKTNGQASGKPDVS